MIERDRPARVPVRRAAAVAIAALCAAALGPMLVASPAAAHSELIMTSPDTDGTVTHLPDEVSLTFSEDLVPPASPGDGTTEIVVYDASCEDAGLLVADPGRADMRDCHDYSDGFAVVAGPTVTQALDASAAPAGVYTVVWRVLYNDGHVGSQMFTFEAEEATAPTPVPTEGVIAPTADPAPTEIPDEEREQTPSATPSVDAEADHDSDADQGGLSTGAIIAVVAGVVVLGLLIAIVTMILRARRS
ncbi:copper resistance CopC family protein [Microbacterium amylolyticum]|uniref:Methionine-rich copper-binding protein CopC n=1 Tax=Microbacterium amylolyticum TaxID=936337 RepID=A0ABS4ZFH3_9MICO|nr:copper resistance CopC family protein [Microbacterium amylolyticum]MBP2436014.1 methionine-rich copper-binding protein CopC [Microbacterium amylolyticum]